MPLYAERPYLIVVVLAHLVLPLRFYVLPYYVKVAIYNGTTCSVTTRINA